VYLGVIATIEAKPAHLGVVLAALKDMLARSRAETGCLQYDLHVDANKPCSLVMVERWTDAAALDLHLETPHFRQLQQTLDGAIDNLSIIRLTPTKE